MKIEGIDPNRTFPVIKLNICSYAKEKATKIREGSKEKIASYRLSQVNEYVFDAICALYTEDKPYVSSKKINQYLFKYREEIKQPHFIRKYTYDSLEVMQQMRLVKRKKNSYTLTVNGSKRAREKLKEMENTRKDKKNKN